MDTFLEKHNLAKTTQEEDWNSHITIEELEFIIIIIKRNLPAKKPQGPDVFIGKFY